MVSFAETTSAMVQLSGSNGCIRSGRVWSTDPNGFVIGDCTSSTLCGIYQGGGYGEVDIHLQVYVHPEIGYLHPNGHMPTMST